MTSRSHCILPSPASAYKSALESVKEKKKVDSLSYDNDFEPETTS